MWGFELVRFWIKGIHISRSTVYYLVTITNVSISRGADCAPQIYLPGLPCEGAEDFRGSNIVMEATGLPDSGTAVGTLAAQDKGKQSSKVRR